MRRSSLGDLEQRLAIPAVPDVFGEHELEGLPESVRRYFRTAISPGTPLALAARFRMRGSIKVGKRWLTFRARQILAPHHGFVWAARAGGVIVGSDRYGDGKGAMDWRILGLFRIAHGEGHDVSRSAAGRAGAEALWVPTALLPRFGVAWTATDPHHLTASYRLDDTELEVNYTLDEGGQVRSVVFDRWGDPDNSGMWKQHPFGFEVTGSATFDGVTIARAGRAGWFYGTDRWSDGEFFRSEVTEYQPVTHANG